MIIYLDIETLPSESAELREEFAAGVQAPAQYKKPESIQQWMADNRDAVVAEKLSKTSFDGLYGQIACIAWAFDDGEIRCSRKSSVSSEEKALRYFFEHFEEMTEEPLPAHTTLKHDLVIVGHNVAAFDLPFIKHRAILNGIKPPHLLRQAMNAKPWDSIIGDTMLMWSPDREKRVGLDRLCRAMGIKGKDGFDGSMVAETWKTDPHKVIQYCMDDVARVREVYKKLTFQF